MTRLTQIKKLCENKRVLDIGCYGDRTSYGHPLWLHGHIEDVADEVVGIDINESGIEELQQNGYDVHLQNAEEFDIGRTFDVVVAAEVIEHLTNPAGLLDNVESHLNEDGYLLLTTPNLHSLFVLGAYFSPFYSEEEHSLGLTPTILTNLLERCGWIVDEIELLTHEDIPRIGTEVINALVPNRLNFTIFCIARPK
jgi:2-polyprenyl-3-methyl-5-hydroxy-6-metoxy-1,4-benzoquinol methylase